MKNYKREKSGLIYVAYTILFCESYMDKWIWKYNLNVKLMNSVITYLHNTDKSVSQ